MARGDPMMRVRVPTEVKEWLAKSAEKNLRTQAAEVVSVLREKMEAEQNAAP